VARIAANLQTGVARLGCCITAYGPSMARLLNAARAIFDPPGIFKWEGLVWALDDAPSLAVPVSSLEEGDDNHLCYA